MNKLLNEKLVILGFSDSQSMAVEPNLELSQPGSILKYKARDYKYNIGFTLELNDDQSYAIKTPNGFYVTMSSNEGMQAF